MDFSATSFADCRDNRMSTLWNANTGRFSMSLWFVNRRPNDAASVTAYLASRGSAGDPAAPGDHLGIGGTYRAGWAGN